jgi:hypothetical protein
LLDEFPSGSSINFHNEKFYVIGDDATHLLVLDREYQKTDSVYLFDYAEKRIPKADKTDLEGSVVLTRGDSPCLLIVGSASRKNRKRIILIPFSDKGLNLRSQSISFHKTKVFIKKIGSMGIDEVNLEGVCVINGDLVLGNRGNRSSQNNHLIITDPDFWEHQEDARLLIKKLSIPKEHSHESLGLSELCYVESIDLLLLTLTSEATDNAYDDGAIGNSYLAWIENASQKMQFEELATDGILNLADVDPVFKSEKIEGVCVESVAPSKLIVHLIADNDLGESKLFKIQISWQF